MIKHLPNYVMDVSFGTYILSVTQHIHAVLNRPIADEMLNIVNTAPQREAQIYGWKSPIPAHSDNTGYFFFMPVQMDEKDEIHIGNETIELKQNNLYLLDDRIIHSTTGTGNTIALFSGSYNEDELNEALYQSVFEQFKLLAEKN